MGLVNRGVIPGALRALAGREKISKISWANLGVDLVSLKMT
jgi:hypothetical protein